MFLCSSNHQLAYALDLQNQETAAKINDHISELAEETTDHSATVTWITLLTLFYLPRSFVSVSHQVLFLTAGLTTIFVRLCMG